MKMKNNADWRLMRETEERIKTRLERGVLLDHLSSTEIEQLAYLSKHANDEQLSKALNETLLDPK